MYLFNFLNCTGCSLLCSSVVFSLQLLLLLQSMGSKDVGSAVVAHRLSYLKVCGIFLKQGLNLCLLPWKVASQPLDHQGRPEVVFV